jgi:O-antigen/teichoic acid export membrane protein
MASCSPDWLIDSSLPVMILRLFRNATRVNPDTTAAQELAARSVAGWRAATARRLRFNTGSKLAADAGGRALQFGLIYFAQRQLGPAAYGQFTYALAAGFVLATLTDFGLQLTVTRDMARSEAGAGRARLAGVGFAAKVILALAALALLGLFCLSRPAPERAAAFLVGAAMIGISFVEMLGYVFRGLQRVEVEAGLTLLMRLLITAFGAAALWRGWGVAGLGAAHLAGAALAAGAGYGWLRTRFFVPQMKFAPAAWWGLLREALPLGGAILFSVAYTRTAVFLLEALRGPASVGLYGVAQKLTEPTALAPAALMAAVFPAFAQGLTLGNGQANWLGRRSVAWLAVAGGAAALAGSLGGPWVIGLLYGTQYRGAEVALQLLSLSLLFSFVNYGLTHFLIALGRQRLNLVFNAGLLVINAGICLALIPTYGPAGAAAGVLISEVLLCAACGGSLYVVARHR